MNADYYYRELYGVMWLSAKRKHTTLLAICVWNVIISDDYYVKQIHMEWDKQKLLYFNVYYSIHTERFKIVLTMHTKQ